MLFVIIESWLSKNVLLICETLKRNPVPRLILENKYLRARKTTMSSRGWFWEWGAPGCTIFMLLENIDEQGSQNVQHVSLS